MARLVNGFRGYMGATKVTNDRRMKLPESLFEDGGLSTETELHWTYDDQELLPVFMTAHPNSLKSVPCSTLIDRSFPYASSERTVGAPKRYFADYEHRIMDPVPPDVQLEREQKLFIVSDIRKDTLICHLFRVGKLSRVDVNRVVQTPAQRAKLIADLQYSDWQSARNDVDRILTKVSHSISD